MDAAWNRRSIEDLAPRLERRELSCEALTAACLDAIRAHNGELNAFITVLGEQARAAARALDREIAEGRYRGPLHGIPISLKDIIDMKGIPTTAASRISAGHVAADDAPVVARLRRAGAVLVGKCNLHEFAMGTTTEESAYGPARNPIDVFRSAGGSSGGSAIAVATGMSIASIGTDTGGSIRIPAAACGVVGLKGSYGEISCDGVVPLSRSLDHVGPLTRTVADARLVFHAMREGEASLPWLRRGDDAARSVHLREITIGVPRGYFFDLLDEEVRRRVEEAIDRFRAAGAAVHEVEIAGTADVAGTYVDVALAEAADYHRETIRSRPLEYTPGVRSRIETGSAIRPEQYQGAQARRAVLKHAVDAALAGCHALVLPALAIPAPPLGASTVTIGGRAEPVRSVMLRLTQVFNLTGHPAISIPCGHTSAGLPCGLQLVGRSGMTDALVDVAEICEPLSGGRAGLPPSREASADRRSLGGGG